MTGSAEKISKAQKPHILLLEPDVILAEAYGGALRLAGYTVAHSTTAQRAVQAADEHAPDLVMTELQLARHNGVEFLYEFKSYSEWAAVPVVVLVGGAGEAIEGNRPLQSSLGVRAVVDKTQASLQDICRTVDKVLASAKGEKAVS